MNLKNHVGLMVKLARQRAGLTQEQLAEQIGKAVETISNIERGYTFTGIETLERMSVALNVPMREFFEECGNDRNVSRNRMEREHVLRELSRSLTDRELHISTEMVRLFINSRKTCPQFQHRFCPDWFCADNDHLRK